MAPQPTPPTVQAVAADETAKMRESVYNACETVFKMTAGAFLGLLAGKGASPERGQ